tara:strand:- start:1093 stop:1527 length:435 start_codon:yes stop_codon:yes gene_type:complete
MERGFVLTVVLILVVSMFASNLNTRITGSFTHHKPPMELVGDLVVGHYLGPAPAILKYFFPPDPPKPPCGSISPSEEGSSCGTGGCKDNWLECQDGGSGKCICAGVDCDVICEKDADCSSSELLSGICNLKFNCCKAVQKKPWD